MSCGAKAVGPITAEGSSALRRAGQSYVLSAGCGYRKTWTLYSDFVGAISDVLWRIGQQPAPELGKVYTDSVTLLSAFRICVHVRAILAAGVQKLLAIAAKVGLGRRDSPLNRIHCPAVLVLKSPAFARRLGGAFDLSSLHLEPRAATSATTWFHSNPAPTRTPCTPPPQPLLLPRLQPAATSIPDASICNVDFQL
jgi:hypothetical protein